MPDGHTFVAQTDLTRLSCDLVLVPTDVALDIEPHWLGFGRPSRPQRWGTHGARVTGALPQQDGELSRLVRWVNTGSVPSLADVDWLIGGVVEALDAAWDSLHDREKRNDRARHLVGLPLFGLGAGGYDAVRGEVLDRLLAACDSAVQRNDYDLVICCLDRADYAALQSRRLSLLHRDQEPSCLPGQLGNHANRLGGLARQGRLALFLGAGVSRSASLPDWRRLIRSLTRGTRFACRSAELMDIPAVDAARLLEEALGPEKFLSRLKEELSTPLHALGHALLASLRAHEAITTNFDGLYEQATEPVFGSRPRILPWQAVEPGDPWLLKMHGDVDRGRVVLSRDAYLSYDAQSRPLASMVQATMMTGHLLFVGYSLADENFVRLGRDVSRLLRDTAVKRDVGTVLSVDPLPMLDELWGEDLQHVRMPGAGMEAARFLDIFLDQCATVAAANERSYLLDPRYRALVGEFDTPVRQQLIELARAVQAEPGHRWADVRDFLQRYGGPG
jgi:NAD-dependent SIR2 family protein deacetylase